MKLISLTILLLITGVAASFAGEIAIGSKTLATVSIPDAFRHENEDESTSFLMPRENDLNGPIAMELTCLRDLSDANLSPQHVQVLLDRLNPNSSLLHFGANLATTQTEDGKDDQGKEWRYTHYAVYADKLLITVTIQTLKGREKEPQCKELLDEVQRILTSLKRKKA